MRQRGLTDFEAGLRVRDERLALDCRQVPSFGGRDVPHDRCRAVPAVAGAVARRTGPFGRRSGPLVAHGSQQCVSVAGTLWRHGETRSLERPPRPGPLFGVGRGLRRTFGKRPAAAAAGFGLPGQSVDGASIAGISGRLPVRVRLFHRDGAPPGEGLGVCLETLPLRAAPGSAGREKNTAS